MQYFRRGMIGGERQFTINLKPLMGEPEARIRACAFKGGQSANDSVMRFIAISRSLNRNYSYLRNYTCRIPCVKPQ
jgi:hypothetical protein